MLGYSHTKGMKVKDDLPKRTGATSKNSSDQIVRKRWRDAQKCIPPKITPHQDESMAYEEIEYEPNGCKLPEAVQALVDAAEARFDSFYAQQLNKRYPRYVASEPDQVYAAIKWITDNGLAVGENFIEWGSGFGVATCMARTLGYEATGIELRQGLVDIARELADSQQLDVDFLCSSYIPEGFIEFESGDGTDLVPDDSFGHSLESGPVYQDGGQEIDIAETDLFYGYPWPGEQEMMLKLFDAVAPIDAIFIAYYADREICIYRKL